MIKIISRASDQAGLALGIALWFTLAGCNRPADVQVVSAPAAPAPVVQPQPNVVVQPVVVMQDDYVYYPGYEVYYSNNRHQYMYRDGNAWVTRSSPPRVSIDVLFASPSVRLDFHDSPERHHDVILRSYPRNWAPPGHNRDDRNDKKDDRKDRH